MQLRAQYEYWYRLESSVLSAFNAQILSFCNSNIMSSTICCKDVPLFLIDSSRVSNHLFLGFLTVLQPSGVQTKNVTGGAVLVWEDLQRGKTVLCSAPPTTDMGVFVTVSILLPFHHMPLTRNLLLESIGNQDGVKRDLFLLVTDGPHRDTALLADILGLETAIHRPEGKGPTRVSRNLRFGLFTALKRFPKADKFIILEDDLILSPDFYSYMQQTGWLLENDPSIYCVSAFNHLSYSHTAHDPSRLYRVHTYPAYGWMTSRAVLRDILPKWLPGNVVSTEENCQ
ncbi:Protein O-linked-mannose beta-1,2-N-acetylglucosaminyltransferase 1 [Halocaridina rubra]|uniref:Alpha-1,3-mannosyl-glycoprotein 2-beta-N-acetylglucosaminyltransferase n=1 Tax=Halocaridina rubra TaxID=373956 RepID=A0AAN8WA26_HALRR